MTPASTFAGQKLALFGLGGSGLATVHALKAGGADVIAWDDSPESAERARGLGITVSDLREADWSGVAALVLSPGVPLTHPEPHWTVGLAKAAGIPIIGDIEIFCRERAAIAPDAPFVAITGTNGKSTTTALIAHVLAQAGYDVQMGGNIGTAILSLQPPSRERIHVVELSTFQIDLTPSLKPGVGILLNLTPDHLDRHGTMEAYAAIKERVVASADLAILGVDDAHCAAIAGRRSGPMIRVHVAGHGDAAADLVASEGRVLEGDTVLADLDGIGSLRGAHNWQNGAVATAAARAFGVEGDALAAALKSFPGLAHRMEQVGRRGRVLFVNDSKATNADSTEKALTAFHDVHWIVGGKAKEGGIAPLSALFDRVAHAYLIGASSKAFAETLEGRVPYTFCETLDVATGRAAEAAAASDAPEPVVLLSPACASYDQFRNFEIRGDRFRELVTALG
ncbi:UDP-N-acetylmuramoyl-L-alanine--D-glutamate ligase [Methylobacterium haplocladii]|uniref:UDP-N-acetylmuramoylalanine--D-glutamate ligase n=1 Tax=Methylobacterium haplocladii TaxID=1176176 RepID=A0A512IQ17_9HYPH|nr:UDP-N-acetylmuramoyl-L-alanine--D-glutamate ligase [Methylobacterium haplocladii]GEO99804.1 UDP-N-acetylmuramoylalanine--D-glutamate ligase [Methylobacterium haplocladii]GJD84879.1 UDP-N-acetylmuramoylalanine--D-glutamate ligase [Methylobacterium haplocladii]GLS59695.1 UDP-N-acetylmuramoylalanine--D-glutamate ligase [Methylobacterium haplocladii]